MKYFGKILILFGLFGLAHTYLKGQDKEVFSSDLQTPQKPWTHLDFENDPDEFQFAIVSDRTGSPRPGVFEDAIKKLNWLRPEFVISVGDLIRGVHGEDSARLAQQWNDHLDRIAPLDMPFFHLAGNHDIKANNAYQVEVWNKLFGSPFYSFVYKDVLFLGLFSNEQFQYISDEQIAYFEKVIKEHANVRWTLVFMHHPLWIYPHDSNFDDLEKMLEGRDYTVFAGHHHRYHHFPRKGSNYYVLATTGGGSGLMGNSFGMFDHVTWITMTHEGPVMANLRLDGILPHDVANDETADLSRDLVKSVFFESQVFVDDAEEIKTGKALLTYTNASELPLHLEGRFYHNHYVDPKPSKISLEIPPQESKSIEVEFTALQPFAFSDRVFLEMEGSLGYQHADYPDLKIEGTQSIPIKQADYSIFGPEEIEFIESFDVPVHQPLPGTRIHYTLDGTTPTPRSPRLTATSLSIKEGMTVKALLVDEQGRESRVDSVVLKRVEPGKGLWCQYYESHPTKDRWNYVPNFSEYEPLTIKATQSLDLKDAGKKNEFFGCVYKGYITLPETGTYTFSTVSDDGAIVFIDGEPVVADPVKHKPREKQGTVTLEKGRHTFEMHFYQHRKGMVFDVFFETPGGKKQKVDMSILSYGAQEPESVYQLEGKR